MKQINEVLAAEHRLIGRAAACLDRVAGEVLESDDLRIACAIKLLEFFEDFVDGAHQEKEERHLFPALLDQGLGGHRVRELMRDHGDERDVLRGMRRTLEAAATGERAGRGDFALHAACYAALEREHAAEEDAVLLPLIEEYLTVENEERVLAGFQSVERRKLPQPAEHYARLVEEVAQALGSSAPAEDLSEADSLA